MAEEKTAPVVEEMSFVDKVKENMDLEGDIFGYNPDQFVEVIKALQPKDEAQMIKFAAKKNFRVTERMCTINKLLNQ